MSGDVVVLLSALNQQFGMVEWRISVKIGGQNGATTDRYLVGLAMCDTVTLCSIRVTPLPLILRDI